MAEFVEVPIGQLSDEAYTALLEEFASRDGTDYGEVEMSLAGKVNHLKRQLECGDIGLVYDLDSAQWDFLPAQSLLKLRGGQNAD
ncbi:MAG: YheU family protein [Halieaceae bacterium]|nr:YheU family protein [Halieaceae bacterium]